MRYVSEKRLKELIIRNPEFDTFNQTLLNLIDLECKELPDQKWQTIDEFTANPVDGWCHICYWHSDTDVAYHAQGKFMWCDASPDGDDYSDVDITHVMPIKTPEAPK